MAKQGNKMRLGLYGSMIMAIVLGIYAQDIAYFSNRKLAIPLMVGISIPTILSVFLFLGPPILGPRFNKYKGMPIKEFNIYLGLNILMGLIVSTFSLMVLVAWCG